MKFSKNFLSIPTRPTKSRSEATPSPLCERADRGFEEVYQQNLPEQMPWFWAGLDPDFAAELEQRSVNSGRVVDLGGGSGTQAVALAKRGFHAASTDFSSAALESGRTLAAREGVTVDFILDDVTNTRITTQFDLVLDRGCFHIIAPARRLDYFKTVLRCLAPQGLFFFKCFSSLEPPRPGPFRFSEAEIREFFERELEILELRQSLFQGAREVFPKALFAVMQKRT